MAGQNHHFGVYARMKIPYAIDRYVKERAAPAPRDAADLRERRAVLEPPRRHRGRQEESCSARLPAEFRQPDGLKPDISTSHLNMGAKIR